MVDVTLIGYAVVGLLLIAAGAVGTLKRGYGSAMATLTGGALFFALLTLSITLRLVEMGPWS